MKSLNIPLTERLKGQTLACLHCYTKGKGYCSSKGENGKTKWVCKEKDAHLNCCDKKSSQRFLSCLYNPFTQRPDIIIWHQTRDYKQYRREHFKLLEIENEYKALYKSGEYSLAQAMISSLKSSPQKKDEKKQQEQEVQCREINISETTPLRYAVLTYSAFLYGDKGGKRERRPKNKKYIEDIISTLEKFINCLDKNDWNTNLINLSSLEKKHLDCWVEHIMELPLKNKTQNNYMNIVSTFLKWCAKRGRIEVCNELDHIERKVTTNNVTVVEPHEFEAMMKLVTLENGLEIETWTDAQSGEVKSKKRQNFREWIPDALWLSLLLGGRGDDITEFKWEDLKSRTNKKGEVLYWIELFDFKFYRQHGEEQKIYIPVFNKTFQILEKLGLKDKIGTSEFVIAPEIENRDSVKRQMSRAFRWYWRSYTGTNDNKVTFKTLRKTFITIASIITGDQFKMVQKHTNTETTSQHYLEKSLAVAQMFGMEFDLG